MRGPFKCFSGFTNTLYWHSRMTAGNSRRSPYPTFGLLTDSRDSFVFSHLFIGPTCVQGGLCLRMNALVTQSTASLEDYCVPRALMVLHVNLRACDGGHRKTHSNIYRFLLDPTTIRFSSIPKETQKPHYTSSQASAELCMLRPPRSWRVPTKQKSAYLPTRCSARRRSY